MATWKVVLRQVCLHLEAELQALLQQKGQEEDVQRRFAQSVRSAQVSSLPQELPHLAKKTALRAQAASAESCSPTSDAGAHRLRSG